jgi:hypothetical protein
MPWVNELNNTRRLPAVLVVDRVPFIVWRESKVISVTPADAEAVTDKLLNVFAPVIAAPPALVLVKATL